MRTGMILIAGGLLLLPALWTSAFGLTLTPVITTGLNSPTFATSPPGDSRLFVSERSGAIKVFTNNGTLIGTFITIADVNTGGEGGLLGLAFHPDYAANGYFFVSYTKTINNRLSTVIERYSVSSDPDVAGTSPPKIILTVRQPDANHNAGWIGFSPLDGYLYIPLGDGGGGHDTHGNGQDINTLLGSVLRIDVDTEPAVAYAIPPDNPFVDETGLDEIWVYGVRNPWRAGFDRQTGEFYFGDVGQQSWEEVNRGQRKGNFGWPLREGFVATPTGGVGGPLSPRVDPLHVYPNGTQIARSVVGGVVYRGPVLALQGKYLFAEFYTGDIWQMDPDGSNVEPLSSELAYNGTPIAFGEDRDGNVYLVDFGGTVYRFEGEVASAVIASVTMLPTFAIAAVIIFLLAFTVLTLNRRGNF